MRRRLLCLMMFLMAVTVGALAKSDKPLQYDITGAGSGSEGTILVKVFVYANEATDAQLKRAAVHGVVFRGCEGNASGARQPAMAPATAETENEAYCQSFFSTEGLCQNYASVVAGSYDRVKTKKGYKCGAILQVDKTALRKELERAGVVRKLGAGF